jgi:hypothetical protein
MLPGDIVLENAPAFPEIADPASSQVVFTLPASAAGREYHLICEVHDDGPFRLPAYRRIIITVE